MKYLEKPTLKINWSENVLMIKGKMKTTTCVGELKCSFKKYIDLPNANINNYECNLSSDNVLVISVGKSEQ